MSDFKMIFETSNTMVNVNFDNLHAYADTNYENLSNKPSINGVTLIGNKSLPQIGIREFTNLELDELLK